MSESAKKKLKQMRLPFTIIPGTASSPKAIDNASPSVTSRKRKPSEDVDNEVSNKIVRVTDSKENISSPGVVEISDTDDGVVEISQIEQPTKQADIQTTPTAAPVEKVLHIKLPSCTKSKRKINTEVKPSKSLDEEDPEDSIVYLDDEKIPSSKKAKKSAKKSDRNKRKKKESIDAGRVKKALNLEKTIEEKPEVSAESTELRSDEKMDVEEESDKKEVIIVDESSGLIVESSKVAETKQRDLAAEKMLEKSSVETQDPIRTIPSKSSSPEGEDPEEIQDELIEMLSDDSDGSARNNTSLNIDNADLTARQSSVNVTKLTPKQIARRQEQEDRRAERELRRIKERDLKEQQRLKEKELREEAKRKEKEEKEEARRKEKEERELKRQAEQDKKDEDKRQKEEERKKIADQKEDEKRQKEEERKRQVEEKSKREEAQKKKEQEDEIRKKKAAEAFSKFFVPKKKVEATTTIDDDTLKDIAEIKDTNGLVKSDFFMPFQVRERMMLAPCVRFQINKEQLGTLDKCLKTVKPRNGLYLSELKNGLHKPRSSGKTWPIEDKNDENDVIAVDDLEGVGEDIEADESKIKTKHRAKYLMFVENRRPAYHGTWTKVSNSITARRPLQQDSVFDYEVESDDEWEEEEPGESLHGSDSEKDKDGEEDDYEVDNDFFVPHGHLSDEEMQQNDDEEMEDNHPETQKAKLKILQQEFAAEMKKKTEKIKPRLIGCVWLNGDEDENGCSKTNGAEKKYHCSNIIWRILKAREMMSSEDGIKLEDDLEPEIAETEDEVEKAQVKTPGQSKSQVRAKFNEASTKELMTLVHGNTNNKKFMIREFQAYRLKNYHKDPDFQEFNIKTVDEKIMETSDYKTCPFEGPMFGKRCWLVKSGALQEFYGDENLKLPNEWIYILEKIVKPPANSEGAKKEVSQDKSPLEVNKEVPEKPKEDMKPNPTTPVSSGPKKRVQLLMSVPCGQEIPQAKKNNLISQYLKGNQATALKTDEVIEID